MHRKLYLAAYDIRDPRRLAKVLRVIKGFASGGQKSVYECWLTPLEHRSLREQISAVLDVSEDALALIPLIAQQPPIMLGVARAPADPDFFYIG